MSLKFFLYTSLIAFCCVSCSSTSRLIATKQLDYPSASGVEFSHGNVYIMGDDAKSLLVLNNKLKPIDSLQITDYPGQRIPKEKKPDIEAIAICRENKLWLVSSGSAPLRNNLFVVDVERKIIQNLALQQLSNTAKSKGIKEINVEGACFINDILLLANRGNNGYPQNHFIVVNEKSVIENSNPAIKVTDIAGPIAGEPFSGVSGLCYIKSEDMLIATASTEETNNNLEDGAIGKSYCWFFKNISQKIGKDALKPDKIIDLGALNKRLNGHKIESVCVEKQTDKYLRLLLVSDNDNGVSTLFTIKLKKISSK